MLGTQRYSIDSTSHGPLHCRAEARTSEMGWNGTQADRFKQIAWREMSVEPVKRMKGRVGCGTLGVTSKLGEKPR